MAQRHPTAPQVVGAVELQKIHNIYVDTRLKLKSVTRQRETSIYSLCKIGGASVNVPHATCHTPIVATGKRGSAPGELLFPRFVAIHEDTHRIFVANNFNNRVEIFSETGDFISQLGVGQLPHPCGIGINRDSVYVSCLGDHTVRKFSLTDMCLVRRIGGKGSNNGQFNAPRQVTTDPIGRVFIADQNNDRICIHDPDLNHLRNITHHSMSQPSDVQVSRNCLYVLCSNSNPSTHVITLDGDMLHSFIEKDRSYPKCFCLDPLNNFVFVDSTSSSIRVFSPKGKFLYTIGIRGDQPRISQQPQGVAISQKGRFVCVSCSWDDKYYLQILTSLFDRIYV